MSEGMIRKNVGYFERLDNAGEEAVGDICCDEMSQNLKFVLLIINKN